MQCTLFIIQHNVFSQNNHSFDLPLCLAKTVLARYCLAPVRFMGGVRGGASVLLFSNNRVFLQFTLYEFVRISLLVQKLRILVQSDCESSKKHFGKCLLRCLKINIKERHIICYGSFCSLQLLIKIFVPPSDLDLKGWSHERKTQKWKSKAHVSIFQQNEGQLSLCAGVTCKAFQK